MIRGRATGMSRISFVFRRNFSRLRSLDLHSFGRRVSRFSEKRTHKKKLKSPRVFKTKALNEIDVERVRSLRFDAACLKFGSAPDGISLSNISMLVHPKGPRVPLQKLAPSLIKFLEASLDGQKDAGPKGDASDVLENALLKHTSPENPSGLTEEILNMNFNLREKVYKGHRSEEEANLQIMTNLVLDLTAGSCVLNKRHRRAIKARKAVSKRILMPEDVGWEGLTFGNRDAWYGELDMLITPHSTPTDSSVAVLFEKSVEYNEKDVFTWIRTPLEESVPLEGKKSFPYNVSIYSGVRYSQGFATAVAFSYTYCYGMSSNTRSAHRSLLPTIVISHTGYVIFFYDCMQDIMLVANFYWTRESLIYLWAFLHYYLFFPPSSNEIQISDIVKFGYDGRFYSKRSELHFGYPSVANVFRGEPPEEGYFQDY